MIGTSALSYDILEGLAMQIKVQGKDVLSLGGYDGRHAAACLERGAKSVTVVDSAQFRLYGWSEPEHYEGVTYVESDLMDWQTPADLVEWSNCIYHVKDPWRAMEHVRTLTRECLVLTTSFVPGDEPDWRICDDHDPRHCYQKPTLNGLFAMLRATGFGLWEEVGRSGDHVVLRCKPT